MIADIAFILFGYLLGSIPFGLVLCRAFGYGDIRKIGSGNIGATNVLRTGNKPLALATLILDTGKGAAAVLLIGWMTHFMPQSLTPMILAGSGAIIGHMFPVWLKFKGGKGVATTIGTILAVQPVLGLAICGIWLVVFTITKISSLSALVAFALSPLIAFVFSTNYMLTMFSAVVALIIFWRHHENISRLIKGEEKKMDLRKKSS